jgi:hypothetical protein
LIFPDLDLEEALSAEAELSRAREGARVPRGPNPWEIGPRRPDDPVSCPYETDQTDGIDRIDEIDGMDEIDQCRPP